MKHIISIALGAILILRSSNGRARSDADPLPDAPTDNRYFSVFKRHQSKALFVALAGMLLLVIASCRDPVKAPEGDPCIPSGSFVFTLHHRTPACSANGMVAFWDLGVSTVDGQGGVTIDPERAGLWTVSLATQERTRLLPHGNSPTWSPDATQLMFVRSRRLMLLNMSTPDSVHQVLDREAMRPSWHPDGTVVAFDDRSQVWTVGVDGENLRCIGCTSNQEVSLMPSWHPDGTEIVYVGKVPGLFVTDEIFVMDRDGGTVRRLTTNEFRIERTPQFSPDGRFIAFMSSDHGGAPFQPPQIWIMEADGGHQQQVTHNGGRHPTWTPDGQSIVYSRDHPWCDSPENGVLWVVNVNTGVESQVTYRWDGDIPASK